MLTEVFFMNTSNITNYKPKNFAGLWGVSVKTLQRRGNEELSPQEELVQDIVSILLVFSCRLYGFRKYKKQIERDTEIAKEFQNRNQSNRGAKNQD